MAPNRKSNVTLLVDPTTIDVTALKIHPQEEHQNADENPRAHHVEYTADSQRMIELIAEEERIRRLFSSNHIEANLVQEAQRLNAQHDSTAVQQPTEAASQETAMDADAYWDMPTNVQEVAVEAQLSAMDKQFSSIVSDSETTEHEEDAANLDALPAFARGKTMEEIIQYILAEDRARQMTSASHVTSLLVQNAKVIEQPDELQEQRTTPETQNGYWDFPASQ